jgi:hypothetical protein
MPSTALDSLRQIENALAAEAPFADWHEIVNRTITFYERALDLLATRLPAAVDLLSALRSAPPERRYRVLGDPAVRTALNDALARHKRGILHSPDEAEDILREVAPLLASNAALAPSELGAPEQMRIGVEPYHAAVWRNEREETQVSRRFQQLFEREISTSISSSPTVLRSPDDQLSKNLTEGAALLAELLPEAGRSAMAHVHLVALVDVADCRKWHAQIRADLCQNVSTHAIPGTIFLSPSPLKSPWHAAEALFHEAGHKKLSDLVFTRSIFAPGYSEKNSPTIPALWNRSLSWNSADWSIDRALFAFHVYVHLGLFFALVAERAAELEPRFGPLCGMNPHQSARGAYNKARYLGREIRRLADNTLGADGRTFVDWMMNVLDRLDPSPPVDDPSVHLMLDRYDRETREIGELLRRVPETQRIPSNDAEDAPYNEWSARRLADHLVHSEMVSSYRILSTLGEPEVPTFPFYHGDRWSIAAPSTATPAEQAAAFIGLRTFISRTLRATPEESYSRECHTRRTKPLRELLADTVEHAGRHIDDIVQRLRMELRG